MKLRGFSLVEMVLSMSLLSVFTLLLFLAFRDGTRTFNNVALRQGLEGEARRCTNVLEQSLRQSDLNCCELINTSARQRMGISGATVSRDAVSYVTLSRWWDESLFDAGGRPQWDEYAVIYATLDNPGKLVRQLYRPPGSPYNQPLPGFSVAAHLSDDPQDNPDARETHLLSGSVEDFELSTGQHPYSVEVKLILTDRQHLRAGALRASQQRLQIDLTIRLNNTQP